MPYNPNKQLTINCLHTGKPFQVLLFIVSNSIDEVFLYNKNNLLTSVSFLISNDINT